MLDSMKNMIQGTQLYKKLVLYESRRHYDWIKSHLDDRGGQNDKEISNIINYIEKNNITDYSQQFYYAFCSKYDYVKNDIYFDETRELFYACGSGTKNNRLYFSRSVDTYQKAYEYYKQLCIEQDKESPHCYLSEASYLSPEAVVVDIGAADGNFSLYIIDDVKKIYIFECDPEWIEALSLTFYPYRDKVEIIKEYVSDRNDKKSTTLDLFFKDKPDKNIVVKMDIEGMEIKALEGMVRLLDSNRISRMFICAYHRQGDEKRILRFIKRYDYKLEYAYGYIMKLAGFSSKKPYYRRGIMRITFDTQRK